MPESANNSTLTPPPAQRISSLITILILLALIIGGAMILVAYGVFAPQPDSPRVEEVSKSARSGEYDLAIAQFESIVDDDASSANRIAAALLNVSPARLRGTGNIQDAFDHIRDLKEVALSQQVRPELRAQAITMLANAYDMSGMNLAIFTEVYKDEPFQEWRGKGGSITASTRNLLEWAYKKYPLSRTAIGISLSHVRQVFGSRFHLINAEAQAEFDETIALEKAKAFLAEADILYAKEKEDPRFTGSVQHVSYNYWRTFVIGALAYLEGGTHKNEYKNAYNSFISTTELVADQETSQYLNFAYFNYATLLLLVDKDEAMAKVQLQKLVTHVEGDRLFDVNQFVMVMRKYKKDDLQDFNTEAIKVLTEISPEFKSFLDRL